MKILVVEDNKKLAEKIKEGLELEEYTVDLAGHGKEALVYAAADQCDLIILDISMPEMDGFEFLKIFRDKGNKTPVLILSARDDTSDKINGLDLGADDYLTKPFSLNELYARVRSLLRRSTSGERVLVVDNLTLHPKTKKVTRAGLDIKLSSKEFRLLEYLMRNKSAVKSEEDILTHGWNREYDAQSNIVAVYIRYLRNKIDKDFPNQKKLIHTVRGLGYKIEE